MDQLLRHGAMPDLFGGIRAPSTLGRICGHTPGERAAAIGGESASAGPGAPRCCRAGSCWRSSISTRCKSGSTVIRRRKQGAGFGHTKIQGKSLLVRGLNALAATICTPLGAPVIAGVRLRGGTANSARGAATFAAEAIAVAREAGCRGLIVVRADSAYYSAAFCGAVRRAGAASRSQ